MNQPRPAVDVALRRQQAETMLGLSRLHQQVLAVIGEVLERRGVQGLSPARANALLVLFQARGPMKARELARALAVSEVTASRMVRRLEDDGWMERAPDPADGRAMLLRPTARARSLFPELVQVTNDVMDAVFAGLDRQELNALSAYIGRVADNVSR